MRIREMATAFLFHQDRILMMKKPESRICPTEFWSGVGGHLEPGELNHPLKACLREIEEETGLQAKELRDIRLRYILLRQTETEIRQQYVYFASADHPNVVVCRRRFVLDSSASAFAIAHVSHYLQDAGALRAAYRRAEYLCRYDVSHPRRETNCPVERSKRSRIVLDIERQFSRSPFTAVSSR
ncbi:NUDIX domain-containing protein [Paenibacillus apiarius]|uniref:NUDIX domain-containing protein n=1 Tax=Paenibacillus apiarius TaxID=46240 RepID=UPI003B3BE9BE